MIAPRDSASDPGTSVTSDESANLQLTYARTIGPIDIDDDASRSPPVPAVAARLQAQSNVQLASSTETQMAVSGVGDTDSKEWQGSITGAPVNTLEEERLNKFRNELATREMELTQTREDLDAK